MRFFYDCEFIEDGVTIDLISIGVVGEDGSEYYAISTEFDERKASAWVRKYVLPKLPSPRSDLWRSRTQIRDELLEFLCPGGEKAELWAWYAAYDHVALAQLWGSMPALPAPLPRFTKELRQRWEDLGKPELPKPPADAHDSLVDARHNLVRWQVMEAERLRLDHGTLE